MKRIRESSIDTSSHKKQKTLPPLCSDVLSIIFAFLDDVSLFLSASLVNKEWNKALNSEITIWKSRVFNEWPSLQMIEKLPEKPWDKKETEFHFWKRFYIAKQKPKKEIFKTIKRPLDLHKQRMNSTFYNFAKEYEEAVKCALDDIQDWTAFPGIFAKELYKAPNDQFRFLADSVIFKSTSINAPSDGYRKYKILSDRKCFAEGSLITLKGKEIPFSFEFQWRDISEEKYRYGHDHLHLILGNSTFFLYPKDHGDNDEKTIPQEMEELREFLGIDKCKDVYKHLFEWVKHTVFPDPDKLSYCDFYHGIVEEYEYFKFE